MAYVLSSVSGNLISAASAGYAPTNSADVSAIASAYQVVSATSTQLYAGTAYVTSVNEAPISAARAGNAANASLATSAYYDGTGRLISSLPDSATVSAIASSYAESAASGKQNTLTFGYDTSDNISSINGSSIGGQGGTTYVSPSGTVWISGSSIEGTDSAYFPDKEETLLVYSSRSYGTSIYTGYNAYTATGANLVYVSGGWINGTISALDANDNLVSKSSYSDEVDMFSASAEQGPIKIQASTWWSMQGISAYTAGITPAHIVPLAYASAVALKLDASASSQFQPKGYYQPSGNYLSASTVGFADTNRTAVTSMSGVKLYGTDSAFKSFAVTSGTYLLDTTTASAVVGTGHGQVSVYISGRDGQYFYVAAVDSAGLSLSSNNYPLDPTGRTVVFSDASAVSSLYIYGNAYGNRYSYTASAADIIPLAHASSLPTYQYDADDKISSINGSAIAGGAGGVDSATVSAIASSYAESAVSAVSGDYYSTSNPSGFIDSAYVDSAVSGKADSSALSSYALSADVSGAVDLVSTQSANWGGSALALSAGPGVKLEKSGNVLVASTDETLLWENTGGNLTKDLAFPLALNEPIANFERVKFLYGGDSYMQNAHWVEFEATDNNPYTLYDFRCDDPSTPYIFWRLAKFNISGTAVTNTYNSTINLTTAFAGNEYNTSGYNYLVKIVGINRTAEA